MRGVARDWFQSYLSNREQVVQINGYTSDPLKITFGVPPGTILSPVLFSIYVNDLCDIVCDGGQVTTYADDTVIHFSGDSWVDVFSKTNSGLQMVSDLLAKNLLTLNIKKTNYMLFSLRPYNEQGLQVKIHSCRDNTRCSCPEVTRESVIRYLGLMLDSRLNWSDHVRTLTARLRKTIYILMDRKTLFNVYYALVQSLLSYGNLGWGGAGKTLRDRLTKVQKLILKIIIHKPPLYSTDRLFADTQVLDVRQLFVKTLLLHYHKQKTPTTDRHDHDTRTRHDCLLPRAHKSLVQHHYIYLAPKLYNHLPPDTKQIISYKSFKSSIHSWIFETGRIEVELLVTRILT